MRIYELLESASAGATGSGAIATVINPKGGKKPSEVGTLFGGTYGEAQHNKQKKKILKRSR